MAGGKRPEEVAREIVREIAARTGDYELFNEDDDTHKEFAGLIVTALRQTRRDTIEECAQVADARAYRGEGSEVVEDIAGAIRDRMKD